MGTTGTERSGEPLQFGIPLQKGALKDTSCLELTSEAGRSLPVQAFTLSSWPDGSIRWLCLKTLIPTSCNQSDFSLTLTEAGFKYQDTQKISQNNEKLSVLYGVNELLVNNDALDWQWTGQKGECFCSRLKLNDKEDKACSAKLDENWQIESTGPVTTKLSAKGWWFCSKGNRLARFSCHLNFYANGLVVVEAVIHNPRRAQHSGGLWDLGDPGSILFGGMYVETDIVGFQYFRLSLNSDQTPRSFSADQKLSLHQESSGGENWNSRNHVNAKRQVLPRYRGFRLRHGQHAPEQGFRAEPVLEARTADSIVSLSIPKFWQNFPSAFEANCSTLRAWLFPSDRRDDYELQGGERKSQRVVLGYGLPLNKLNWSHSPLVPILSRKHYEGAGAFPWFRADAKGDRLQGLIMRGVDGSQNFFQKREIIDEYGWRNFGDLFADHETLYQQPREQPFISHYNNQYDPIYGFARQFALTGDMRWHELMDDLARHVTDIDIYHTEEDRVEYNNGLFWHTDHYLDAHSATHRTFSKHNASSSTPGQTGGGPGPEHCYTTGLLYHYWITGNTDSAQAVLKLANWMRDSFESNGGLLAQLLALKKQELPNLKALVKGQATLVHRYPFTRATGNYLNTLLDAWLLTGDQEWRDQAERVIRQSIHPNDDPAQRDLLNVEISWSYLVLLTSITRYLFIKAEREEQDEHTQFAHHALVRYTRWMSQHEQPFLAQKDQLEFPNHTWTAQDIRKASLLYIASYLDAEHANEYQRKADTLLEGSFNILERSPETDYTRILVILMQNQGPQKPMAIPNLATDVGALSPSIAEMKNSLTWTTLLNRILRRLIIGLLAFSPKKEKAWLKTRLNR